jgi:hypothetical protein
VKTQPLTVNGKHKAVSARVATSEFGKKAKKLFQPKTVVKTQPLTVNGKHEAVSARVCHERIQ